MKKIEELLSLNHEISDFHESLIVWIVRQYQPVDFLTVVYVALGSPTLDQLNKSGTSGYVAYDIKRGFVRLLEEGILKTVEPDDLEKIWKGIEQSDLPGVEEFKDQWGGGFVDDMRIQGSFMLSNEIRRAFSSLGISLSETVVRHSLQRYSVVAYPIFGELLNTEEWSDVFVLMPFREELYPVYTDHIKPVVERSNFTCKRGDDFFSTEAIMQEVWSAIHEAKVCIAECTGRNPNVFYELGIAHTLGKPVILIAQSIDDIPFDIRHIRTIIYDYTPRGMSIFEDQLHSVLLQTLNNH